MFEKDYLVKSITEYIDTINEIIGNYSIQLNDTSASKIWFRGQTKDNPLIPSVFREKNSKTLNEFMILNYFKANYRNYTDKIFDKTDELLAFMQHYDAPTRLIDWSENHLIALYFAIEENKNITSPVVWVLNTSLLNSKSFDMKIDGPILANNIMVKARCDMPGHNMDNPFLYFKLHDKYEYYFNTGYLEYPVAYYPNTSGNLRIIAQKGVFTIHGKDTLSIENLLGKDNGIYKIEIDINCVEEMQEQLRRGGMTPRTVYPDLFGLGKELSTNQFRKIT